LRKPICFSMSLACSQKAVTKECGSSLFRVGKAAKWVSLRDPLLWGRVGPGLPQAATLGPHRRSGSPNPSLGGGLRPPPRLGYRGPGPKARAVLGFPKGFSIIHSKQRGALPARIFLPRLRANKFRFGRTHCAKVTPDCFASVAMTSCSRTEFRYNLSYGNVVGIIYRHALPQ